MKQIFSVLLVLTFCITLMGCAENDDSSVTSESFVTSDSYIVGEPEDDDIIVDEGDPADDAEHVAAGDSAFYFDSTLRDGSSVTFEDYSSNNLILVNLWEPWCGPCVEEMPYLEELYKKYKDKGFSILGFYDTPEMEDETDQILKDAGVTYPIIHADDNVRNFYTDYVPTSFFVKGDGTILSTEPVIGANSFEDWEAMVLEYL